MKKAVIIQNDKRMEYLKEMMSEKLSVCENIRKDKNIDIIILPLPCSRDGETINCVEKIKFDDIKSYIKEDGIVFGGKIPEKLKITLEKDKIIWYDYFSEGVEQKNALATAEGTVKYLIENTSEVLFGKKILITGYGRIAEYLVEILKGFNAEITIATSSDLKALKAGLHGMRTIKTEDVNNKLGDFDIIVNTSPCFELMLENKDPSHENHVLYVELAGKFSDEKIKNAQKYAVEIVCAAGVPAVYLC